jgi:hypothetical protein
MKKMPAPVTLPEPTPRAARKSGRSSAGINELSIKLPTNKKEAGAARQNVSLSLMQVCLTQYDLNRSELI